MAMRNFYWKLRDKKLQLLVVFILTIILYVYNFYWTHTLTSVPVYKSKCNFDIARHLIENMCSLNKDNKDMIIGNMCPEICNPKNNYEYYNDYRISDCFVRSRDANPNLFDESKTVLIYELQDENNKDKPKKLVFKSTKQYYLDFDTYIDEDFKRRPILDQLNYLQTFIDSTLSTKFGVQIDKKWIEEFKNNPKETVNKLRQSLRNENDLNYYVRLFDVDNFDFYLNALTSQDSSKMANFIQSLIILMSQDEYLFYRFYQQKPGALKIYGSCGHFYLVEYAHPLTYKVRFMDTNERKNLALQFLSLTHNLDTTYLLLKQNKTLRCEPVQMCDVKLDNFGLNHNGELRIIDTDMASPDSYLFSTRVCKKHEDCHFFDCKSFCDPGTSRCLNKRINNNLQTVCEKLFDNNLNKLDGILTGVEFESNIQENLMSRLEKCKNPGFYKDSNIPIKASDKFIRAFSFLLSDTGIKLGKNQK